MGLPAAKWGNVWLLKLDMLEVALTIGRRSGRKQTQPDVIRWLQSIGLMWCGDDLFIGSNDATRCLYGNQIVESCRLDKPSPAKKS